MDEPLQKFFGDSCSLEQNADCECKEPLVSVPCLLLLSSQVVQDAAGYCSDVRLWLGLEAQSLDGSSHRLYMRFLSARRYASAGLCDSDVSGRLSDCPDVCPSHAGIVPIVWFAMYEKQLP